MVAYVEQKNLPTKKRSSTVTKLAPLVVALACGSAALPAAAYDHRFEVRGGWFFTRFNTDLRVDSNAGLGTDVNLEDDLGMDQSDHTWFAGLEWRIATHHRLSVEYFNFDRSATRTLNKEISIDEETYPVGSTLSSEFNLEMLPVAYSYSFIRNERHELAGSIGVHWTQLEFNAIGSASLNGTDADFSTTQDSDLPLPLVGGRYSYNISERWQVGTNASYFYLSIDNIDGSLLSLNAHTEYWVSENFAVGGALDYFRLNVDASQNDFSGDVKYSYFGPKVFLKVGF